MTSLQEKIISPENPHFSVQINPERNQITGFVVKQHLTTNQQSKPTIVDNKTLPKVQIGNSARTQNISQKQTMTQSQTQAQSKPQTQTRTQSQAKAQIPPQIQTNTEAMSFSNVLSQLFSLDALSHGVAGTIAGNITMALFYPLDQIRLRSQVEDKTSLQIIKEEIELSKENPLRLYEGLGPLLFSLACSNFVYFYCNNALKLLLKWRGRKLTVPANLIIASLAGCINVLVTNPLWVVNTRVRTQGQIEKKKSMIDVFQEMIQEEGVKSLWNGTTSSLLLVSNPTIQFVAYDTIKRIWTNYVKRPLYSIEFFLLAAIAKSLATFITYPLQVAQSQIRAQRKAHEAREVQKSKIPQTFEKAEKSEESENVLNTSTSSDKLNTSTTSTTSTTSNKLNTSSSDKLNASLNKSLTTNEKRVLYKNTLDCLINLYRREGIINGWFKGFSVKFSQTVLMAAFHFLAYEKIMAFIYLIMRIKH